MRPYRPEQRRTAQKDWSFSTFRLCDRGAAGDICARPGRDWHEPDTCGGRGSHSWKGRGPSAVDSTLPGAVPKYPDPGEQGNDLSRSRGDWIRSGAGLFPSGFPSPPSTCFNFSLWRVYLFGKFRAATLAAGVRVWEGFIDSGDAVPVAV